jgi:hypothetical protein
MPRSIYVSAPAELADAVLRRVKDMDGIVGLGRHSGASLSPPGDVLVVHTTNDATRPVFEALNELGVFHPGGLAAAGMLSDTLHVVIAAIVIARGGWSHCDLRSTVRADYRSGDRAGV